MSASYSTGSNPLSATSAADLRTALDAVILAHPNWSLVEAINITGGTSRVYKCSGSGANANSWALDFYLAMTILTASPTQLHFQVMEAYNANGGATSAAVRQVRNTGFPQGTTLPPNGNGYIVDNTAYTLDNTAVARNTLGLDASSITTWACHVSKSRIEVAAASASFAPTCFIGGLYVPNPRAIASFNAVFPLFAWAALSNNGILSGPGSTANIGSYPVYFSRSFASSGSQMAQGGLLIPSSSNACGLVSTSSPISDPIEGVIRGTGVLVSGSIVSPSAGAGYIRGSLPGLSAFYASSGAYPRPTDVMKLSDNTQLMLVSPPIGGLTMAAFVDVASDN